MGYTLKNGQWYLNGQAVKTGDQGYDRFGNLNEMQSNGKWKTLQKATKEGIEARKRNQFTPKQKQTSGPESLGGKAFQWVANKLGYKPSDNASDLAGMVSYFTPVGNYLAAGDAINSLRKRDWGGAAMNAVFAIPAIGNVAKIGSMGLRAARMANAANKISKGANLLKKIDRPANMAMNAHFAYEIPGMGKELYSGYKDISNAKQQMSGLKKQIDELKSYGATDQDIKGMLGSSYNDYTRLTSRDNSFLGNLGTMYDYMSK